MVPVLGGSIDLARRPGGLADARAPLDGWFFPARLPESDRFGPDPTAAAIHREHPTASLVTAISLMLGKQAASGPVLSGVYSHSIEVWAEARAMFDRVFAGEPVSIEDFTLGLARHDPIEEAHFEFAYTPVRGEAARWGAFSARASRRQCRSWRSVGRRRQRNASGACSNVHRGFIAVLAGPDHLFEFANEA